jgi:deoxyribodipyrimidine photo-lyase
MLAGLVEVEQRCTELSVPFTLLSGHPEETVPEFCLSNGAALVTTDFSPLRVPAAWALGVADTLDASPAQIPLVQVDAHNIVPCWHASDKLEYGARTIRPKIERLMPSFMKDLVPAEDQSSRLLANGQEVPTGTPTDWKAAAASLTIDRSIKRVKWLKPGSAAGLQAAEAFIDSDRFKVRERSLLYFVFVFVFFFVLVGSPSTRSMS